MHHLISRLALLSMFAWVPACADEPDDTGAVEAAVTAAAAEPVRQPGPCSQVLHHEILIGADAETVFDLVVDLPRYAEWNPWIVDAAGDMTPGGKVAVRVVLNGKVQDSSHVVLAVDPYTRVCWRDAGWNAAIVYGQRCRTIETLSGGGVRLTNELLLDGPFAWLARLTSGASLDAGMTAENEALRARAEAP